MKLSKKKMLEALEPKYSILKWENGYNLYDNNRKAQYCNGGAFVAHIEIDNGNYIYQGNKYNNVEDLTNAIESYIVTLPFNHEFYDPVYNKTYFVEMCCNEYLNKLGFTRTRDLTKDFNTYEYKNPLLGDTLFKLRVVIDDRDKTTGKIYQNITDFKWIEVPFKDLESAIGAINSIVAQNAFIGATSSLKILSGINDMRSDDIVNMVNVSSVFRTSTTDMQEQLIPLLEKELAILKNKTN